ncbi:restriction endonuclease subunit S [Fructilactobacillus cliffordii]|uniref:Restriction endonuclease subunit S n=1 Tax=Fructilactobacillus cliffordii TaxID=2940299 RepID=A0A9Q8ZT92_9LACO|nr:restriction endonuclease subunit S [Fructilactobacillus cliffordii]USS89219.1 restriction endonuclease subunit S [Fructilactobacillus cliffordii]
MELNEEKTDLFPEIRFHDFSENWQRQKLNDVTINLDKLRVPITKNRRRAGDTPYYGANGIQDYVTGFTHKGKLILIAEDGASDLNDYPIQLVTGKIWVNNHAHILAPKEQIAHHSFIGNSLKNVDIKSYLTGAGRAKLNKGALEKIALTMPSFSEQEKIGTLFEKINQVITVKKRKLELLHPFKVLPHQWLSRTLIDCN